jgi:hypothetical protein
MTNQEKTIKADPGFFIVEPIVNVNGEITNTMLIPIIGWIVVNDIEVKPISMHEVHKNNRYPILTPTGKIFSESTDCYESIKEWVDSKNEWIE